MLIVDISEDSFDCAVSFEPGMRIKSKLRYEFISHRKSTKRTVRTDRFDVAQHTIPQHEPALVECACGRCYSDAYPDTDTLHLREP